MVLRTLSIDLQFDVKETINGSREWQWKFKLDRILSFTLSMLTSSKHWITYLGDQLLCLVRSNWCGGWKKCRKMIIAFVYNDQSSRFWCYSISMVIFWHCLWIIVQKGALYGYFRLDLDSNTTIPFTKLPFKGRTLRGRKISRNLAKFTKLDSVFYPFNMSIRENKFPRNS